MSTLGDARNFGLWRPPEGSSLSTLIFMLSLSKSLRGVLWGVFGEPRAYLLLPLRYGESESHSLLVEASA